MCYTCSQLRCCWCVMLFWLYMYGRGYMRIQYIMYDACYGYSSMCCCTESNVVFPERGRAPSHTPCPNLRIANLRGRVPPSPPHPPLARWCPQSTSSFDIASCVRHGVPVYIPGVVLSAKPWFASRFRERRMGTLSCKRASVGDPLCGRHDGLLTKGNVWNTNCSTGACTRTFWLNQFL